MQEIPALQSAILECPIHKYAPQGFFFHPLDDHCYSREDGEFSWLLRSMGGAMLAEAVRHDLNRH